jgi:hypothetical protein
MQHEAGERIELAWHGANHSPDNIFIHLPGHETLILVDIVNAGWAPISLSNLTEDIPGYVEARGKRSRTHGSTSSAVTTASSVPATTTRCTSSTWPISTPASGQRLTHARTPQPLR